MVSLPLSLQYRKGNERCSQPQNDLKERKRQKRTGSAIPARLLRWLKRVRSESSQPRASGLGGVAMVYRCLVFGGEGAWVEVKDGFEGTWYPGNVVGSSGFYESEKRENTYEHTSATGGRVLGARERT
jgi:hypothetical protein